jgi:hypothetical protein
MEMPVLLQRDSVWVESPFHLWRFPPVVVDIFERPLPDMNAQMCRSPFHARYRVLLALILTAAIVGGAVSCAPIPASVPQTTLYKRDVSGGLSDIAPVRGPVRPLRLHRDGDEYECTTCHDGFPGDQSEAALKDEHKDISFDHGLNLRCLNCHNPKNCTSYVNHDGSEIPADKPTLLCAKCHGPLYREWQLGIHGRVNGAWSPKLGEQHKLECIQCHNPHRPKFQPLIPEPPPVLTRFDLPPRNGVPSSDKPQP